MAHVGAEAKAKQLRPSSYVEPFAFLGTGWELPVLPPAVLAGLCIQCPGICYFALKKNKIERPHMHSRIVCRDTRCHFP